jgi:hypothetical protein
MYGPFHRLIDSEEEVRKILDSGEIWGKAPTHFFQSDFPKVKAYGGPLPRGKRGVEFVTAVEPDRGHVPGKPTWCASAPPPRRSIITDGIHAKIKVEIRKQTVIKD